MKLKHTYICISMLLSLSLFSFPLLAQVSGDAIAVSQEKRLVARDRATADGFGFDVDISGTFVIVGASQNSITGTEEGSAYIYSINQGGVNNWGQVKRLIASDRTNEDEFGYSVAICGDYAVVGALKNDLRGTDEGAVYVFYRNRGGADKWGQVKRMVAPDRDDQDNFGVSVDIDGDDVIVGAYRNDLAGINEGAAYVFNRNQGGTNKWGYVSRLLASNRSSTDEFGWSVSISGDHAVVSSYSADVKAGGANEGAAYVYHRNMGGTDNWGQVKRLTAPDKADNDLFGTGCSIDGLNIIVGAMSNDLAGTDEGSAYIFNRDQGGTKKWGHVKRLVASDRADEDNFGRAVSISGDYAIVGAYKNDIKSVDEGAAYIFFRNQGGADNWGQVKRLLASDRAAADRFGNAVTIDGDYMAVGAYLNNLGGTDEGTAYVFKK